MKPPRLFRLSHFERQFTVQVRGHVALAWRRWGKQHHRLTVGPFEFGHGKQIPLDVLTPWGSLLTVTFRRGDNSVGIAARKHAAKQGGWMPLNNRALFLAFGGQGNLVEVGVGRRSLVLTWFTDDLRISHALRRKTPADVLDAAPAAPAP